MTNQTGLGLFIITLMLLLTSAFFIPIIQGGFGTSTATANIDGYADSIDDFAEAESLKLTSLGDFIGNIFKLAWFKVSGLPFWLDFIYTMLFIVLIISGYVLINPFSS